MMYYLSWHFYFQDRCTPLHLAVRMGRLGAVQTLLDVEGPQKSINYQDKVHRNPYWKKRCLQMCTNDDVTEEIAIPLHAHYITPTCMK